jgi:hypothetical protein
MLQLAPAKLGGHVAQLGPLQALAQEQVQLPAVPDTLAAWLLQSMAEVHSRTQSGNPVYPSIHTVQSWLALYKPGHWEHVGPLHMLRHLQLQPVKSLPVTLVARPEQLACVLHVHTHLGGVAPFDV